MGFRELIKKVQLDSGFSDSESRDALEMMVESLAVRLNEGERKDFASQLPEELQNIALSVMPTEQNVTQDIIQQFMENEHVKAARAKKQIQVAWAAIKSAISEGQVRHIQAQLPKKVSTLLA
jgi:uncharacterized protein (DUF2267 family)